MKKKIWKRLLSLALALVMVAGWLPHMATEAYAAAPIELEGTTYAYEPGQGFKIWLNCYCSECKNNFNSYTNYDTHKYEIKSYSYSITGGNYSISVNVNFTGCNGTANWNQTLSGTFKCTDELHKTSSAYAIYDGSTKLGSIALKISRDASTHNGNATCVTADNCNLCGTSYTNTSNHEKPDEFTYSVNTSDSTKHDVKFACCGATKETVAHTAEPTYTVNATDHTKHDITYSCCEGIAETAVHSTTYFATSENVVTESCTQNCGHSATATLQLKSGANLTYTGSAIEPMEMVYKAGWVGEQKQPISTDYTNNVNVGTEPASCSFTYTVGVTVEKTFSIEPASLSECTVTMNPASGVYDGSLHDKPRYTLTYNGKELTQGTDYNVVGGWNGDFTNAGNYILDLTGKGNFEGTKTLTYTINKADPTANLFQMTLPENAVYDGTTPFQVDVTTTASGMGDITVKYKGSPDAPINAGNYTVTVDVAEGDNYNAVANLTVGNFTVAPADGSATVTVADVEYGDAVTPVPVSTTNGTDHVTYQYKVKDADDSTYTDEVPTAVGSYTVKATFAETVNYTEATATADFEISKRKVTVTADNASKTYGGTDPELTWTVTGGEALTSEPLTGITISRAEGENAGGYTITVSQTEGANPNYEITFANGTFTINKAPLTVTAEDKTATYGDAVPAYTVTYDGFVNGENEGNLSGALAFDCAYIPSSDKGGYTITPKGYESGNYEISYVDGTLTVNPKELDGSVVSIPVVSLPYTGEAQTVAIAVPEGVTYELVDGMMTATNVSRYEFTIQFTGNHTGMITLSWQITAVAPSATAPTPKDLTYNGEDQTLIAAGATNDGTMVYSLEKEGEYTTELPKAKTAGTYHLWYKVIGDGNHTDSDPVSIEVKIDKADPGVGTVTANVVENTLDVGAIVLTLANIDIDGNLTVDAEQSLAWGDNTICYTFTPNDTTNYKVVKGEVTVTVVDTIAPTGTVTVSTKSWAEFLNNVTFGLFFKETQTVSVTASDNLSGVAKIEYIESKTALDLDAVKAATQWTEMEGGSVSVTLEDTKQFVYYIRITDKAGNVTFLSSDGAEYDTTAPLIAGVDNGVTYYTTQHVAVTDKNIETITLNGEAATSSITLEGNKEASYTIVATDKAGNSTTITVKMAPIADIVSSMEGKTDANVNSDDKTNLQIIVDTATELLQDEDITAEEKAELEKAKADAEALIQVIVDTAAEQKTVTDKAAEYDKVAVKSTDKAGLEELAEDVGALLDTDNLTQDERADLEDLLEDVEDMIDTIEDVAEDSKAAADTIDALDPATVTSDDKDELEEAIAIIDELLKDDHLTADERKALEDVKADAEALIEKIETLENVEHVTDAITQLPGTVEPDDEEAAEKILDAKESYDKLTDHEKSLVDETTKKKLDDLVAALTAYDIIKGDGSKWTSGDLSFTANGPFSKFVGIKVDGKEVAAKYYDAKAGSTIITLKQSFLKRLSTGEHTITVLYTDGETSGTFKILAASSTPATGDDSNIMLWSGVLGVSTLGLVPLLADRKRRISAK